MPRTQLEGVGDYSVLRAEEQRRLVLALRSGLRRREGTSPDQRRDEGPPLLHAVASVFSALEGEAPGQASVHPAVVLVGEETMLCRFVQSG